MAGLTAGIWAASGTPAVSGGENRTISLYHVHTGEKLTVTYMVNGKYVPSAMKQINHLLRDWRKNSTITIDPRTVDLVWELHADLGSRAPIHIVCGYRSAATNSMLKKRGRNVARKSQHILGKAIDIYFPDVPTIKMRNSALVRQVGGVGYYRSAGGPTGFLHVDSGRVRHWGPGISGREMAKIFRDYRKTVGARLSKNDQVMLASAKITAPDPNQAVAPSQMPDDGYDDEELAQLSQTASADGAKDKARTKVLVEPAPEVAAADQATAESAQLADAKVLTPKPRPKPIEVLMAAAVAMKIEPASAPPDTGIAKGDSPVADSIGTIIAATALVEPTPQSRLTSSGTAKGSLAKSLRDGTETGVPVIRTITASAAGSDTFFMPGLLTFGTDKELRRYGSPQPFSESASAGILPGTAEAAEAPVMPKLSVASLASAPETASGKGDRLVVNRDGKGNFGLPSKLLKVGQIDQ